jgi:hypothetical protein
MKSLLLLIALGVAGYFAWQNDWPSHALREGGATLERHLNHELSSDGVTDRQIAVQLRHERRRLYVVRWVETDREIAVDTWPHAEDLAQKLMHVAEEDGFDAEKDKIRGVVLLDITKFGLRFQRLVFFPKR